MPSNNNVVPVLYGESTTLEMALITAGAPGSYTYVGNRISIDGPDQKRAAIETTVLDNTWKTFRPSNLPDAGSLKLTLYFNPEDGTHGLLMSLLSANAANTNYAWRLTFSDGTKYISAGFLVSYGVTGIAVDSNVQASLEIHLTGAPNYIPGGTGTGVTSIIGTTGLGS